MLLSKVPSGHGHSPFSQVSAESFFSLVPSGDFTKPFGMPRYLDEQSLLMPHLWTQIWHECHSQCSLVCIQWPIQQGLQTHSNVEHLVLANLGNYAVASQAPGILEVTRGPLGIVDIPRRQNQDCKDLASTCLNVRAATTSNIV